MKLECNTSNNNNDDDDDDDDDQVTSFQVMSGKKLVVSIIMIYTGK